MKTLSLYCGAGGIDEGLKQSGIITTLAIDRDKDACNTMKLNHPDTEIICGNVSDFLPSFGGFDIVVGGPPCPEFSRANVNRSFDMCEVNNFWEAVERASPKYFLMENVQDVKKKLFRTSFLINAADFGIPQIRLRRFFTNLPMPEPTHAERSIANMYGRILKPWVSVGQALGIEGTLVDRKQYYQDRPREYKTSSPSKVIHGDMRLWLLQDLKDQNPVIYEKHLPYFIDKPAHTIAAKDYGLQKGEAITDGVYARKITLDELACLQGFPKDYIFSGSKGSIRRQIGNAVPPPIINAFFGYDHERLL